MNDKYTVKQVIETIMERNGYDKNSDYDRRRLLADLMFELKDISVTDEELELMKKAVENTEHTRTVIQNDNDKGRSNTRLKRHIGRSNIGQRCRVLCNVRRCRSTQHGNRSTISRQTARGVDK